MDSPARYVFSSCLALGLVSVCGCGPKYVEPPALDPQAATNQAMKAFDTNGDGQLDAQELRRSPGLRAGLEVLDTDDSGSISSEEIASRLRYYINSRRALMLYHCQVLLNGKPLSGAKITLVPEPFLESVIEPATATTDVRGFAMPTVEIEDPELRKYGNMGVRFGLYRVEISRQDRAGKELIPEKYNSQTELGAEIMPEEHVEPLIFRLSG